jgi:hypothetical protein
MYGEGYDYAPQYTAMSGDMAGSLPVGIQTSREKDIPYWPVNNCYNYKEVWVQPSCRWLWLMSDLAGTAKVSGKLDPGVEENVEFLNTITGKAVNVEAEENGEFMVELPQGQYTVTYNNLEKTITLVPGEKYNLDLKNFYSIVRKNVSQRDDKLVVELEIVSNCTVELDLKGSNISFEKSRLEVAATNGNSITITVQGNIADKDKEYLAVIIPNGNIKELLEAR